MRGQVPFARPSPALQCLHRLIRDGLPHAAETTNLGPVSTDDIQSLPANPDRQADGLLHECEFQVLNTISAWLDLRGDERLAVEGAKDFDGAYPLSKSTHTPTKAQFRDKTIERAATLERSLGRSVAREHGRSWLGRGRTCGTASEPAV